MQTITTVAALRAAIEEAKQANKTIGLVPTMGALHEGHLSLIHKARQQNDLVVVSVFVNPIQFNNQEDLAKYPRTVEADCEKLATAGADIAFVPSVEEMYPEPVNTVYHFGPIEEVMEGPRRPGHFSGVAVVVRRLFDLTQPNRAYFGEKDYQQIAIIRNLLEQIKYPIEIVPCPIVRAEDGLALSSRNMRLSAEARAVAPNIYATLQQAVEMSEVEDVESVRDYVIETLSSFQEINGLDESLRFEPEYFEIVDDTTLQPITDWADAKGIVGCIAVWLTGVRLIDMVRFR
jgi:pantoate--beta-alanine ligase